MRRILTLLFVAFSYLSFGQNQINPYLRSAEIDSLEELLTYLPGLKYAGNPIINAGVTYTNIAPGGFIVDPLDPTQYLLYVGEFIGNSREDSRISMYIGSIYDIYDVSLYGVVLTQTAATFDSNGVAFGSAVYRDDTVFLYYGAQQETTLLESAGVAISVDGGRTFSNATQALAPLGTDVDRGITDPYILMENDTFFMVATRKNGTTNSNALPTSLLIAYSLDGFTFTRTGDIPVSIGSGTDPDSKFIEGGQWLKFGDDYVLLYTADGYSDVWSLCLAYSETLSSTYTKLPNPVIEHSASGDDSNGAAVPNLVHFFNEYLVFYQGTSQFQPATDWDIFITQLVSGNDTYPAGYLDGKNGWDGDISPFDISGDVVISGERTLRGLKNSGTVEIDHAATVVPNASSSVKCTIRIPTSSPGNIYVSGFYLMEGSNIITAAYFHNGRLEHLKSGAWEDLGAATANTDYEIEFILKATNLYDLVINGSTVRTNQAPFTNVVTSMTKIRLEKSDTNTIVTFWDDIECISAGVTVFAEDFEP